MNTYIYSQLSVLHCIMKFICSLYPREIKANLKKCAGWVGSWETQDMGPGKRAKEKGKRS